MSKKVKDENKEYVSLPYFGINKLLPYLKPYRFIIISMVTLGLLGGFVDIISKTVKYDKGKKAIRPRRTKE